MEGIWATVRALPLFLLTSCFLLCGQLVTANDTESGCQPPDHTVWDALVQKHVNTSGRVSYKGFRQDAARLEVYLRTLSECPPAKNWTVDERLAYWINAYNAFTVKLILDHYPVQSIKDIGPKLAIPLLNSVWDLKFFRIGGEEMSLNRIEHDILRKEFDEPRIHFAIVCASHSCPKLLNRAYVASSMQQQLQQAAVAFINDPERNRIAPDRLELSSIFNWFKGDFTKKGTLTQFVARYAHVKVHDRAKVSFLEYDWSLNGD